MEVWNSTALWGGVVGDPARKAQLFDQVARVGKALGNGKLAERIAELPDGVEVIAYRRGRFCVFAHDAVRLLNARGRAARRLRDGMLEGQLAGLPVAAQPRLRRVVGRCRECG